MTLYVGDTKYKVMVGNQKEDFKVPLPYDYEVEWLRSDGSQYIDTEIECTSDLKVEFTGMVHTKVNNADGCGGIHMTSPYFRHHWRIFNSSSITNIYWYQYDADNNASVKKTNVKESVVDKWYDIMIDPANGRAVVNGTDYSISTVNGKTTGKSYGIFARIANTGAVSSHPCSFKMFKIWKNSVLVRDYIPVVKDGVGYLYDKVSGTLFGNVGSGAFTYGNDVTT